MAEVTILQQLELTASGINAFRTIRGTDTQAGTGFYEDVVALNTVSIPLATGGVTDAAWFHLHNLDASATIEWGLSDEGGDALLLQEGSPDLLLLQEGTSDYLLLQEGTGVMGFELPPGTTTSGKLATGQTIYAMTASGTANLAYLFLER